LTEFFGKVVFRNDVAFEGRPTFNKDTAGFAQVKNGQQRVTINFEKEYEQIPVVTANITFDQVENPQELEQQLFAADIRYLITERSNKGFTIVLNKPAPMDLKFSWMAIAVSNAKTFESSESPQNTESDSSLDKQSLPQSTEAAQPQVKPTGEPTVGTNSSEFKEVAN
jgi:hypothetical protein